MLYFMLFVVIYVPADNKNNNFFTTLYEACDYLSMLGLRAIRTSYRDPSYMHSPCHEFC